jgi:hypothetical protein
MRPYFPQPYHALPSLHLNRWTPSNKQQHHTLHLGCRGGGEVMVLGLLGLIEVGKGVGGRAVEIVF